MCASKSSFYLSFLYFIFFLNIDIIWKQKKNHHVFNFSSQEIRRSREDITRIVETVASGQQGNKYKSTQSLHDLGLDNYPNPEMPESSRLTRREEKQSLQNLNNRLAGMYGRGR